MDEGREMGEKARKTEKGRFRRIWDRSNLGKRQRVRASVPGVSLVAR